MFVRKGCVLKEANRKDLMGVAWCFAGDKARLEEATAIARLLTSAVHTHDRASALLLSGRASQAAQAASECLQAISTRGQMQVARMTLS